MRSFTPAVTTNSPFLPRLFINEIISSYYMSSDTRHARSADTLVWVVLEGLAMNNVNVLFFLLSRLPVFGLTRSSWTRVPLLIICNILANSSMFNSENSYGRDNTRDIIMYTRNKKICKKTGHPRALAPSDPKESIKYADVVRWCFYNG